MSKYSLKGRTRRQVHGILFAPKKKIVTCEKKTCIHLPTNPLLVEFGHQYVMVYSGTIAQKKQSVTGTLVPLYHL